MHCLYLCQFFIQLSDFCTILVFLVHPVRAPSTSAAYNKGISIDKIVAAAGWSTESTFSRFYRKPIASTDSSTNGRKLCTEIMSMSV